MNLSDILDERLAIVGGTGSGKSYTARGLVEKVLASKHGRVGIIDPTGVWHGLRLMADGKSPGFPVVIFGGDRSDVPLIDTAGRVVAQAVASTHQSWIIDTSALKTKASERRFMLDFLDALYETNRAEITLVVDEADRFSPQRMTPETARLHERMEETRPPWPRPRLHAVADHPAAGLAQQGRVEPGHGDDLHAHDRCPRPLGNGRCD